MPSATPPAHRLPIRHGRSRAARNAMERLIIDAYTEEVTRGDGSYDLRDVIPEAWDRLERDVDLPEAKTRVTIRLDQSVAKFFRAHGPGYQALINRVLATYAHMKIAEVELGERRVEAYLRAARNDLLRGSNGIGEGG
ncbi:BrnA antitoxin family protein [Qingshengfaniella alkalisoli]|uniref:BrnA antitoxin family protein n=1 Tax=Qingshengfaniella alkalisoli TaxID=2599296 RepID=A0A5B8J2W2_9RHOB|nr:BrnA antitoxin family protein [Qingshengfaniella alkalisoli]QDY68600.1 BrnA antitoxin family protein [Qingshengfaniella alkalisoli]